jgi:hypothetical protein
MKCIKLSTQAFLYALEKEFFAQIMFKFWTFALVLSIFHLVHLLPSLPLFVTGSSN